MAWLDDEGKQHSCCLWATPEELETDAEAFDCETCPVRAWQQRLSDEDRTALRLFKALTRPGVQDMGLVPVVFEVEGLVLTRPEARGLLERLAVLYQHAAEKRPGQATEGED